MIEQSIFAQKDIFKFSLTTHNNLHHSQQFLITQILDSNFFSQFRYQHTIGQEAKLQLEIGKDKKLFYWIINHDDYYNKTHQMTLIYNYLTFKLYVEIIQVQNGLQILWLQHEENLKLNILQIGGQEEGLLKYSGIIQLTQLSFKTEQLISFLNYRLIESQNEFQLIVLNKSQQDFIIFNNNHTNSNQIVFYGNIYERKQELNLQFDNYQRIIITDLFLQNENSRIIIDSQSKYNTSFIIQNSTLSGYFWTFIQNFSYLEINDVNFNNVTELSFKFPEETTNLTIKIINTTFYNCSFSKSLLFPAIQSGDITFTNVQFIKCLFEHNSFIQQPNPGFLQIFIKSILIIQSDFYIATMFSDVATLEVHNFKMQECTLSNSIIFSGNSQIMFNDLQIYNNSFDQSYLFVMYISNLDKIQYPFKLDGLIIINNTIKHQVHLIAVTQYKYCSIKNCIYKQNQLMSHQKLNLFWISAQMVSIKNFHIEKISFQTEFNIVYSEILIVENIAINGINNLHTSFIEINNSTQFILDNITISNLVMKDTQLFIFQIRTLSKVSINDVQIQDVKYSFSNFSLKSNIEMFKLIDCHIIHLENINLFNITYFIGVNELRQSYLIFHLFGNNMDVEMINITIQNVQSYSLEQYSGIIFLSAPIMYVEGSVLQITKSRFENLECNSTTSDHYIGLLLLNQILITSSNFSNIVGIQIFQVKLQKLGFAYFFDCIFNNITLNNQDSLMLFDSQYAQLTCQINEIILKLIQCNEACKFIKFISSQINNYVAISNIQLFDIELIQFISQIDKCLVAIYNVTAYNQNLLLSNKIELQCNTIIMQNLSFQGSSFGSFINIQYFRSLQLYQIYIINSVFFESSVLQIKTKNMESLIIIKQLEIINSQIISQDIFPQRILEQLDEYYLIDIMNQDAEIKIFIENSKISNNICNLCQKGLINIFSHNISDSKLIIQSTLFQRNKVSQQNLIQIQNFKLFELRQVVFYNNTFGDQYLISILNTKIRIFQCQVFNDRILENFNNISDYNIQFSQFYGQFYEQNNFNNNNSQPQTINQSGIPLYLRLFYKDAQFKVESYGYEYIFVDQVIVNKFLIYGDESFQNLILLPSNNKYPYSYYDPQQQINIAYDLNYTIRIIDKQGEILLDQQHQQLQVQQYLYNLTLKKQIELLDEQLLDFDRLEQGFILEKLKIKFNPYSDNSVCIQLKIKYEKLQHYELSINIRTFKCQIGEYLFNNACHQCDQSNQQYSLKPHQQICRQVDFYIIEEFKYNQVKLRKGFWRSVILSEQFIQCENNPHACQGGWRAGNQQCSIRYIGPMCEECDQNNIMGNGYYHKNYDNKCYQCNYYQSSFIIFFTIVWIIILSIFVIRNIQHQNKLFQQYFLQYKQFEILYKLNQNQQNTCIKQFINISQLYIIISLINEWQLDNPFDHFYFFISNPLSFNKLHIQCLFEIYDPRYLLIIYVFSPYFLLLLLVCIYFISKSIRAYSKTLIYFSSIIFVFYLMQPNIIKELGLFLSFRQILDNIYIKGSLQHLFHSIRHQQWIKIFIAPQILYYSITLPLLIFYQLFKIRNDLFQKINRFKFNLFINDYKTKFYFWEIYRIFNREIMVFIIIFYDNHMRQLQAIFLLLSVYCFILNKFKPFNLTKFNKFEGYNFISLLVNIILSMALCSLQAQDSLRQIMLVLIYTTSFILLIIVAYQLKLNTQRLVYDSIRKIMTIGPFKLNQIQNWIQKKEQRKRQINIYWNLFKTRSRRIGRYGSNSSLPGLDNHEKMNNHSTLDRLNNIDSANKSDN